MKRVISRLHGGIRVRELAASKATLDGRAQVS
jgi:hypothetical protein